MASHIHYSSNAGSCRLTGGVLRSRSSAVQGLPLKQALRGTLRPQKRPCAAACRGFDPLARPQRRQELPGWQHCFQAGAAADRAGSGRCRAAASAAAAEGAAEVAAAAAGPPPATLRDYWQLLLPDSGRLLACAACTLLSVVCTIAIGPAIGQGVASAHLVT